MQKLSIAEKRFSGVVVGYVVGWPFRIPGWNRYDYSDREVRYGFHSIRKDAIFPTLDEAKIFRAYIESARQKPAQIESYIVD